MAFEFMPGATVVGISYNNGVILAAEKRVSFGNFVVNKSIKKTFPVTDHVGAACAGMVADMQVLVRQVEALAKIRKLETRREVPPNSVAKLMSVIMFERRYFPLSARLGPARRLCGSRHRRGNGARHHGRRVQAQHD
jgi:proteasome beta subunit